MRPRPRRSGPTSARSEGVEFVVGPGRGGATRSGDRGRHRPERARGLLRPWAHAGRAAEREDPGAREQGVARRRRRARDGPDQGRARTTPPRGLRARGARDGASRRAPGGPEAGGDHRLRRPVPRVDGHRARQGLDEGGPPASGLVDGPEDHDRLGDADEQGPRGDRGALPLRPRVLADPRADPPRGGRARDRRVPRRLDAGRDGDAGHAAADPARPGVARTAPDRRGLAARSRRRRSRSSPSITKRSRRSTSPTASAGSASRSPP